MNEEIKKPDQEAETTQAPAASELDEASLSQVAGGTEPVTQKENPPSYYKIHLQT